MSHINNMNSEIEETSMMTTCSNFSQNLAHQSSTNNEMHDDTCDKKSIVPYTTLCTRRRTILSAEEHAEAISNHLQLSNEFMKIDPSAASLRIELLRAMPQCLSIKKRIKDKLGKKITLQSNKAMNFWQWSKYRLSLFLMKIKVLIQSIFYILEPWHHLIKEIEGHFGSGIATYFKFLRWMILSNVFLCILSILFIVIPQSIKKSSSGTSINLSDFLTGGGFFANSLMYYGFYTNGTTYDLLGNIYDMPSAYFFTLFSCYSFTLILVSVNVAISYRKCYTEIASGAHNLFTNKVFCGWDFTISSVKLAHLWSASLHTELKEILLETKKQSNEKYMTKIVIKFTRTIITIAIFIIICSTDFVLWTLLNEFETDKLSLISIMLVTIIITLIMNVLPGIIAWLAKFEFYGSERTKLYVTIIRTHLMAGSLLGVLLAFYLIHETYDCWQTHLGEVIYRLVILDFIISVCGSFVTGIIRSILYNNVTKKIGRPKFDVAQSTLILIYNQLLFWIGLYFSPLISLIMTIKLILMLYIKKCGLFNHCEPPLRSWRAAQTQTLFLALGFLGIVGIFTVIAYIMVKIPSSECGPFKSYSRVWDFVLHGILALEKGDTTWVFIIYLTKPAVGAAVIVCLCTGAYCLRAKANASKDMLKLLRRMLELQRKDKEFLIREISAVTGGYVPHESDDPCCSTSGIVRVRSSNNLRQKNLMRILSSHLE